MSSRVEQILARIATDRQVDQSVADRRNGSPFGAPVLIRAKISNSNNPLVGYELVVVSVCIPNPQSTTVYRKSSVFTDDVFGWEFINPTTSEQLPGSLLSRVDKQSMALRGRRRSLFHRNRAKDARPDHDTSRAPEHSSQGS